MRSHNDTIQMVRHLVDVRDAYGMDEAMKAATNCYGYRKRPNHEDLQAVLEAINVQGA